MDSKFLYLNEEHAEESSATNLKQTNMIAIETKQTNNFLLPLPCTSALGVRPFRFSRMMIQRWFERKRNSSSIEEDVADWYKGFVAVPRNGILPANKRNGIFEASRGGPSRKDARVISGCIGGRPHELSGKMGHVSRSPSVTGGWKRL